VPDNRGVVYSLRLEKGREQLWYVPSHGGAARPLPLETASLFSLNVHPDGRRVFFQNNEMSAELWVMEGFLPEDQGSQ
jgi:hypothetical protein